MIAQPHAEVRKPTPRKPDRPAAHHESHRPERRKRPDRPTHRPDRRKEAQRDRPERRTHKSAPEQERTLPIGGGARVPIPSLGTLPITTRRH